MEKYKLDAKISGLIEYINIIIASIYNIETNDTELTDSVALLREAKKTALTIENEEDLNRLKDKIVIIDKKIKFYLDSHKRELTGREKALIERGYDEETVRRLSSFSEKEIHEIAENIFQKLTDGCTATDKPVCIYLGGQPGCGKSTLSRKIKNSGIENGIVELGLDNYRTYHPNYIEMEKEIKKHWKNKTPTRDDTPGNDIADFTHNFAGYMTDILTDLAIKRQNNKSYNIVFEWGMREPNGPLATMKKLKEHNYTNIVNFIAVHKDVSLEACEIRADIMNGQEHIVRRVPDYFHKMCISQLPNSVDTIYEIGYNKERIIDSFNITNRTGKTIWNPESKTMPGEIYNRYLNDKTLTRNFINEPDLAMKSYIEETQGIEKEQIEDEENIKSINM